MTGADDLFNLLPAHLRTRDDGLLEALLTAIATESAVLDDDIRQLYDDAFVETASEWALPYLADLLGIDDLPDGPGRRAVVANMIDYRRRKGTVGVAEQVVRDVAAAPARSAEYCRLLSTTAHVNHVRIDRPGTALVRSADERAAAVFARGALDPHPHAVEVRRMARGRGRYGIGNVGVFSFGTAVFPVTDAEATAGADGWWVHPLGIPRPLFARPVTEDLIDNLAGEAELAVPLRPRRLLDLLREARAGEREATELPVGVSVVTGAATVALDPVHLRAARVENLSDDGDGSGWRAMIDPVYGFVSVYHDGIRILPGDPKVTAVLVTQAFGGRPTTGAEPYDHSIAHEEALENGDDDDRIGVFRLREPVSRAAGTDPASALAKVATGWAAAGDRSTAGATSVVTFEDSARWDAPPPIAIPAATRLVLVGTAAPRYRADGSIDRPVDRYAAGEVRPVIQGDLEVTGGPGSALLLDGITIVGDLVVHAEGLGTLALCQVTVTGTVRVDESAAGGGRGLTVRVTAGCIGGIDVAQTVPAVIIANSVVSAEVGARPVTRTTVSVPGGNVELQGSTVRGDVVARTLLCTDALVDGMARILNRQVGCARYSYFGAGSATPRRFRCVPASDDATPLSVIAFVSADPGAPGFLELSDAAGLSVRTGSEHGDEMGVDARRRRPTIHASAAVMLTSMLPVGIESFVWNAR